MFEIGPSAGFIMCLNYIVCLFFILSPYDRGHVFLYILYSTEHTDGAILNTKND